MTNMQKASQNYVGRYVQVMLRLALEQLTKGIAAVLSHCEVEELMYTNDAAIATKTQVPKRAQKYLSLDSEYFEG